MTGLGKHAALLEQTDPARMAPHGPVLACLRSHTGWGLALHTHRGWASGWAAISRGAGACSPQSGHDDRTRSRQPGPTGPRVISQSGRQCRPHRPEASPFGRALMFTNADSVLLGPRRVPCAHPPVTCAASMPTSVPVSSARGDRLAPGVHSGPRAAAGFQIVFPDAFAAPRTREREHFYHVRIYF